MSALEVSVDRSADVPTLALRGELDLAGTEQFLAALDTVELDAPPVVVVDLRGLTFLDSSGLRVLLSAHAEARRSDRRLVLVRAPAPVQRVFEVALLDRRLEFVDDPADAAGTG
jgi:anti-sigma B factor antagonist